MPTTTDPGLKLAAVAEALRSAFGAITGVSAFAYNAVGSELPLPAATIDSVTLSRVPLDVRERHIGIRNWMQTWEVTLYVAFRDPAISTPEAWRLVGEMSSAIDFDPVLNGEADEARLVRAVPSLNDPAKPVRMIVVACEVQVLSLMPAPQ